MSGSRIKASISAEFSSGDLNGSGEIRNLGADGLFVLTSSIPDQGEPVRLEFSTPGGDKVEVSGLVWWTTEDGKSRENQPPGFGLRILAGNGAYQDLIDKLLQ